MAGTWVPGELAPDELLRSSTAALRAAPGYVGALAAHGRALYRAGQFAEAASTLERSLALAPPTLQEARVEDRLFLAMARCRSGDPTEGKRDYDAVVGYWSQYALDGKARTFWGERVIYGALQREAQGVLSQADSASVLPAHPSLPRPGG